MAHGFLENAGTEQGYYNGADWIPNTGDEQFLGNYQFITIQDIIDNFTATYIGEGKLLNKVNVVVSQPITCISPTFVIEFLYIGFHRNPYL